MSCAYTVTALEWCILVGLGVGLITYVVGVTIVMRLDSRSERSAPLFSESFTLTEANDGFDNAITRDVRW